MTDWHLGLRSFNTVKHTHHSRCSGNQIKRHGTFCSYFLANSEKATTEQIQFLPNEGVKKHPIKKKKKED